MRGSSGSRATVSGRDRRGSRRENTLPACTRYSGRGGARVFDVKLTALTLPERMLEMYRRQHPTENRVGQPAINLQHPVGQGDLGQLRIEDTLRRLIENIGGTLVACCRDFNRSGRVLTLSSPPPGGDGGAAVWKSAGLTGQVCVGIMKHTHAKQRGGLLAHTPLLEKTPKTRMNGAFAAAERRAK